MEAGFLEHVDNWYVGDVKMGNSDPGVAAGPVFFHKLNKAVHPVGSALYFYFHIAIVEVLHPAGDLAGGRNPHYGKTKTHMLDSPVGDDVFPDHYDSSNLSGAVWEDHGSHHMTSGP